MKISIRELHVGLSKPLKERTKSSGHKVVTVKTRVEVKGEEMEPVTLTSLVLTFPTMASLFRVVEASLGLEVKVNDLPIEERAGVKVKMGPNNQTMEAGIGPEMEARVGTIL